MAQVKFGVGSITGPVVAVVSNLPSWEAFFKSLVKQHMTKKGSAFATPNVSFGLSLDNWAATPDSAGGDFFYYDAVDRGRKQFSATRGKTLAFTTTSQSLVFSFGVKQSRGYNISTKGDAQLQSEFEPMATARFNAWALTSIDDADVLPKNNLAVRANPIISSSFTGKRLKRKIKLQRTSTRFRKSGGVDRSTGIDAPLISGNSPSPKDIPVLRQGTSPIPLMPINDNQKLLEDSYGARKIATSIVQSSRIDPGSIIRNAQQAARNAGLRASFTAASRQFKGLSLSPQSQAILANNGPAVGPEAIRPDDPFWSKLVRLPNWGIVSAIFLGIAKDSVVPFIQNSPTRKATHSFKLISAGFFNLVTLAPASGGQIRGGFVLLSNPKFQSFLGKLGV